MTHKLSIVIETSPNTNMSSKGNNTKKSSLKNAPIRILNKNNNKRVHRFSNFYHFSVHYSLFTLSLQKFEMKMSKKTLCASQTISNMQVFNNIFLSNFCKLRTNRQIQAYGIHQAYCVRVGVQHLNLRGLQRGGGKFSSDVKLIAIGLRVQKHIYFSKEVFNGTAKQVDATIIFKYTQGNIFL